MQEELYRLEGSVETVIYHNEDNGYTVLELSSESELVTVVGSFADIAVGETLVVTGSYATHPKFGLQLKAQVYERLMPATSAAIESYLSSGAIKGVGPVLAKKMVKKFGDDTLTVIEQTPARLTEVSGISPKKAEKITEEYKKMFGIRAVMLFLNRFGVSVPAAVRVWKRYGLAAQELVQNNPYLLCDGQIGLDFETADRIALEGGMRQDSFERAAAGVLHVLRHNMSNGHICLPEAKLAETAARLVELDSHQMEDVIGEQIDRGILVRLRAGKEDFIYLPACYEAECSIASRLALMLDSGVSGMIPDVDRLVDEYGEAQGICYADLQRKAIVTAITNPVMILTGGPGTGKTTAISAIIQMLRQMGEKVGLAAPTGRAAKRMTELTGAEAKTIHRLLEVDRTDGGDEIKFKRNETNPLPYDTVVIDETSMMDEPLFEALLRALRLSSRLILVGDPDQLPSVGAGNVLGDLIAGGFVPVVHLSEIFRQAAQSLIVTNAHAIVTGEHPVLSDKGKDFFFLPAESAAQITATAADLCVRRLPKAYQLSPTRDIQVISPTRVGAAGIGELNRILQQALNPPDPSKKEYTAGPFCLREGDKVMQIKNNYDLIWVRDSGEDGMGVFNGDIGVIDLINRPSSTIVVRFDDRLAEYSFDMAGELELAYAITVHKSQGNEYDAVILALADGRSRLHYRNLLYTAVTRAKKLLIIVGSQDTVNYMVDNGKKTRRYTNLVYLMGEIYGGGQA